MSQPHEEAAERALNIEVEDGEETASTTTIQPMDLWGQRSQPHEEAASSIHDLQTLFPSAFLGDLCGFAVNLSIPEESAPRGRVALPV